MLITNRLSELHSVRNQGPDIEIYAPKISVALRWYLQRADYEAARAHGCGEWRLSARGISCCEIFMGSSECQEDWT